MSELQRGAVVEIVDPTSNGEGIGILLPRRVLINGTDVGLVAKDSVSIDVGNAVNGDPTTVTLTLLVSKVLIRGTQ